MKNQTITLNGNTYRVYNITENAVHAIKQNSKGKDLTINKSNLLTLTTSDLETICKFS